MTDKIPLAVEAIHVEFQGVIRSSSQTTVRLSLSKRLSHLKEVGPDDEIDLIGGATLFVGRL